MTNIRAFAIIHYNEQKRVTINISLNSLAVKNLNIVTYWQILNKYSQIQVPRKYFQSRGHLKVQLCHVSEFFVFSFFSLHSPPATSLLLSDLHSLFLSFAKLCRCSLQNLIVSGRILTRTTLWTYARPCLPNNIGTAMLLCFFFFFLLFLATNTFIVLLHSIRLKSKSIMPPRTKNRTYGRDTYIQIIVLLFMANCTFASEHSREERVNPTVFTIKACFALN